MSVITHFKGATLALDATHIDQAGEAAPLTGVTVTAKLHPANAPAITLDVTVVDAAAGTYRIGASAAATAAWPRGTHPLHVTYERTVAGVLEREIDPAILLAVKEVG